MPKTAENINTIAVITGRDLVGDALIKLPFARALRHAWPTAKIHWVTSDEPTAYGGILRPYTQNLIDEIHDRPTWLGTKGKPATTQPPAFDLILDTRNRWKQALQARKLPHKIFIAMALRHLLSDKHPPLLRAKPGHLCDRLLQMVELAAGYMPPSTGALPVPAELTRIAKNLLPDGPTYIGLAPGCSTEKRMWPRAKFIELAKAEAAKGRVPVFVLGPQELNWYNELSQAVPSAKFPLQDHVAWGVPILSLDHTLALATRLTLLVGNDSGPGHIMAAVDCPVVSLFGPTTPVKAAPRASNVIAVRAQSFGGDTMDFIPVDAVQQAIDEMLKRVKR